jgi:magnesium chelatase family protein
VLFLDELAEFDRDVLDALRQPLEDGTVEIARAHGSVRYPARLQLIAAMNPCRCGWDGDGERICRCPTGEAARYRDRVSGPLRDRVDIAVRMPRTPAADLVAARPGEPSRAVRERIAAAWARGLGRSGGLPNAALEGAALIDACALPPALGRELAGLADRLALSARGVHRVLRVSLTIADLRGRGGVERDDLLAAVALRDPELDGAGAR